MDARIPSHLDVLRSGAHSSATLGSIQLILPPQVNDYKAKPLRSSTSIQSIRMNNIFHTAQRTGAQPRGPPSSRRHFTANKETHLHNFSPRLATSVAAPGWAHLIFT
jgi:hypothetical protein